MDSSGRVFVTGNSYSNGHYKIVTIGYSNAGLPLWTNFCNGPFDRGAFPKAIGVDASGNVFVTGMAARSRDYDFDFVTLAYSAGGVPLWTNSYNGPADLEDTAHALQVDSSGNVIVMGYSIRESLPGQGSGSDYTAIKYSGMGVPLWSNRHHFSYSDTATALATDRSGNVFLTGYSVGGITTIAYSAAGAMLWTNRHIETNLSAFAVAVVPDPSAVKNRAAIQAKHSATTFKRPPAIRAFASTTPPPSPPDSPSFD